MGVPVEQPKKDPQKELDIALTELEERVDRLRTLYEQYFMGFEKTEPNVQRKDVDRRFTVLRKTQIRNTAQRYRFNVISQKFNTYSMYWARICRQIEEGTYKRHVQKAARRFGATPASTREADLSIDIDLTDFEDFEADDLEAALAEANAAAEAYAREDGTDTVRPPEPPSQPAPSVRPQTGVQQTLEPAAAARPGVADSDTPPAQHGPALRTARPAPLPAGAKPRIVVRRRDPNAPPAESSRGLPAASASAPSSPAASESSRRLPAAAASPAPASSRRLPAAAPAAESSRRLPAAAPSAPLSVRGLPAAPPSSASPPDSVRQVPPAPAAPESARRMPLPSAPGSGRPIPAAPASAPDAVRRPGIAPAPGARSAPGAPATRSASPGAPQVQPRAASTAGAGSSPAAGAPGKLAGGAPPRGLVEPSIGVGPSSRPSLPPDSDQPRPSRRPPPPLPSQLKKNG